MLPMHLIITAVLLSTYCWPIAILFTDLLPYFTDLSFYYVLYMHSGCSNKVLSGLPA